MMHEAYMIRQREWRQGDIPWAWWRHSRISCCWTIRLRTWDRRIFRWCQIRLFCHSSTRPCTSPSHWHPAARPVFPQSARQQQPEQKHGGKEANQNVCDQNIAINVFSSIFQRCSHFTTETPATVVKKNPQISNLTSSIHKLNVTFPSELQVFLFKEKKKKNSTYSLLDPLGSPTCNGRLDLNCWSTSLQVTESTRVLSSV